MVQKKKGCGHECHDWLAYLQLELMDSQIFPLVEIASVIASLLGDNDSLGGNW